MAKEAVAYVYVYVVFSNSCESGVDSIWTSKRKARARKWQMVRDRLAALNLDPNEYETLLCDEKEEDLEDYLADKGAEGVLPYYEKVFLNPFKE